MQESIQRKQAASMEMEMYKTKKTLAELKIQSMILMLISSPPNTLRKKDCIL